MPAPRKDLKLITFNPKWGKDAIWLRVGKDLKPSSSFSIVAKETAVESVGRSFRQVIEQGLAVK
jgi:hypothetical protein